MIDLHCHILPYIDDGARDMAESLEMARMALEDGIAVTVCSSHVTPGLYDNTATDIAGRMYELEQALMENGLPLQLVLGADVHLAPDLVGKLSSGEVPTIGGTRYFLFEPPHHVVPPRIDQVVHDLMAAGIVPIVTHPERLTWIETHYEIIEKMDDTGAIMQITAGSLTGRFGSRPRYWAERMLEEGRIDILATDAHNTSGRPPVLSRARDLVSERLGEEEAVQMVLHRPEAILQNATLTKQRRRVVPKRQQNSVSGKVSNWLKKWAQ